MSVFDRREAEDICDMDEECKGFVMSATKTWTGGYIACLCFALNVSIYHLVK